MLQPRIWAVAGAIAITLLVAMLAFVPALHRPGLLPVVTATATVSADSMALVEQFERIASLIIEAQNERLDLLERQNKELQERLEELRRPPAGALLRERLAFSFPYSPEKKFPLYVWQLWKYGLNDDRFEADMKEGQARWAWLHPGFVHELFNDDTALAMVRHLYMHVPEVVQTFERLPNVVLRMDYFRYIILLAKGGVYADVDTHPYSPAPNWIPDNVAVLDVGMVVGIGADPRGDPDWRSKHVRRLEFAQHVIQAKRGHPVLREVVAKITEDTLLRLDEELRVDATQGVPHLDVLRWTGAGCWTDVILTYFNDYVQLGVYTKVTWKEFLQLEMPKLVSDVLVFPLGAFSSSEAAEDGLQFATHGKKELWID